MILIFTPNIQLNLLTRKRRERRINKAKAENLPSISHNSGSEIKEENNSDFSSSLSRKKSSSK